MRLLSLLPGLLLGSSLIACSALGGDAATDESAHTAGQPTFGQHAWLWADETEDEFRKNAELQAFVPGEAAEFLPMDHPMTQRLQFWIDRMDEALRAAHPEALKGTPRPRAIIQKTAEPNAWVSALPVAWNIRTRVAGPALDGGAPPPGEDGGHIETGADGGASADGGTSADGGGVPNIDPFNGMSELLLLQTGRVYAQAPTPFARPHDADKLATFVKFHNDGFARCRLSATGDELILGTGCKRYSNVTVERGERLSYYATAKYITMTSGYILELLDEDAIVSTLAHELGHYYRSHVNMPSDVTNYFYALDANTHTHTPAPDARHLEQTLAVREKLRGEIWPVDFTEENALMAEKGLGFYTTEQEADEIAVELMAKVGLPGGVIIDKLLKVQKLVDSFGPNPLDTGTLKWTECSALRERGFRDADGKLVSVPVGDLSDPHHSLCFRAFNVSREIAAHDYTIAARPDPGGEPWARVLTRMSADVELPAPPRPPSPSPAADAGPAPSDAGAGD